MKKIIKIECPKVIWEAELSIFNRKPIFKTWLKSIQDCIEKCSQEDMKVIIPLSK